MIDTAPVTLAGRVVRLVPLTARHLEALIAVGCGPALWQLTVNDGSTPAAMRTWLEAALADHRQGQALPFAIEMCAEDRIVGSTRFGNIDRKNRRVEIGWTWVARACQRSAVNTEAKLLLLRHAFEAWRCVRVEFKTDAINARSRAALLRIGAKEEGILRKHQITWTGRVRDSVYYGITDDDWPHVRAGLESRLASG